MYLYYKVFCGIPATTPETKPLDRKWKRFNSLAIMPYHAYITKAFDAFYLEGDKSAGLRTFYAIRDNRKFSTFAVNGDYGVDRDLFHRLDGFLHAKAKIPMLIEVVVEKKDTTLSAITMWDVFVLSQMYIETEGHIVNFAATGNIEVVYYS